MTTIKVQFHWATYRPDARQYKQQSLEVNPFLPEGNQPLVEIELPVELLANAEAYLLAGVEGNKPPIPILSVKAVKYLVDQWEQVFSDVSPDDFKPTQDAQDFATEEEWDVAVNDPTSQTDNDNWDEVKPETTEEPQPWNEKDEDWGTEPNFDN